MSEENRTDEMDETEVDAHVLKHGADDQPSEDDNDNAVESHARARAIDEPMEDGDDVEGHMRASAPRVDARVDARAE